MIFESKSKRIIAELIPWFEENNPDAIEMKSDDYLRFCEELETGAIFLSLPVPKQLLPPTFRGVDVIEIKV